MTFYPTIIMNMTPIQSESVLLLLLCSGLAQSPGHQGEGEEEELDEDTRRFNFWTHQVHIFFTRKFFQAAEQLIAVKRLVDSRKLEEDIRRISLAASVASTAHMAAAADELQAQTPKAGDSMASTRLAA